MAMSRYNLIKKINHNNTEDNKLVSSFCLNFYCQTAIR